MLRRDRAMASRPSGSSFSPNGPSGVAPMDKLAAGAAEQFGPRCLAGDFECGRDGRDTVCLGNDEQEGNTYEGGASYRPTSTKAEQASPTCCERRSTSSTATSRQQPKSRPEGPPDEFRQLSWQRSGSRRLQGARVGHMFRHACGVAPAELEQVIKIVGRCPRGYPPVIGDLAHRWIALSHAVRGRAIRLQQRAIYGKIYLINLRADLR